MKVLLLEDEPLLNKNIKDFLELKGMSVESYTDGAKLLEKSELSVDVALLDIAVPGASGYEVIEWIKRLKIEIPTLFMTAYTDIQSIEKAYNLGCSDYLKKPFDLIELYLRIQKILDENIPTRVKLSDTMMFDMQSEQLYHLDKIKKLTKTQRGILKSLINHKNSIVTYEILITEVWDDEFIKINTIASHFKELRKHLPNKMIESIRAEGYRLVL